MQDLATWFKHQAQRERRVVFLEDALLSNRFVAYAFYRLRYFFLRFAIESATHAIRAILLFHVFPTSKLIIFLLLHAGASLLGSFWWGLLEVMRERIRRLRRTGKSHLIAKEIGHWLTLSIQTSIVTTIAGLVWISWSLASKHSQFGVVDLYLLSILFQLSVNFIIRCYHSGMYSIRRIYRPPLIIVGVEIGSFILVMFFWSWLGHWSLPIAALLSTVLVAFVTLHYTARSYRFFGLSPTEYLHINWIQLPFAGSFTEAFVSGLCYCLMHIGSLLVIVLFHKSGDIKEKVDLFALFFILAPSIRAGFDWAQLFYFDLKKLDITVFRNLLTRIEIRVNRLAWFLGFTFWIIASLLGTLVYQRNLGEFYWLMIPFFVSRSLLAAAQIQAFSDKAYAWLITTGILFLTGLASVSFFVSDEQQKILFLSALIFVIATILGWRKIRTKSSAERFELLCPLHWLAKVRDIKSPLRISVLIFSKSPSRIPPKNFKLWEEENKWKYQRMAERINLRIGRFGGTSVISTGHLVWYELANAPAKITEEWLISQGGLLQSFSTTGIHRNGLMALEAACKRRLFSNHIVLNRNVSGMQVNDLKDQFIQMFPQGLIYDPEQPTPRMMDSLPSREKRIILSDAIEFIKDLGSAGRSNHFDVTALCLEEKLRLIFLIDRNHNRKLRSRWRNDVKQFNLRAAFGSGFIAS